MAKKYIVTLKEEERGQLRAMLGSGNAKARTLTHARILLKADEGWQDHAICKALNVSIATIERVRKQFVFEGFEASLKRRRSKRVYSRKVDGEQEAHLVCFDESPEQLVSETRQALPMTPGQLEKYDYEYRREGVSNLFMFFAPLQNWRNIKVTERRTKVDWAYCMRDLVDVHFPQAEKIVIVQDQLNTHTPACLYEVFAPAEAKRILDRLEFHSTPKHGSWLNMAEIELSVLGRQCLHRCIPSQTILIRETEAWAVQRNNKQATVAWQFTTKDARIKLKRLYPSIHD